MVSKGSVPPLLNRCTVPVKFTGTMDHGTVELMKNKKEISRRRVSTFPMWLGKESFSFKQRFISFQKIGVNGVNMSSKEFSNFVPPNVYGMLTT